MSWLNRATFKTSGHTSAKSELEWVYVEMNRCSTHLCSAGWVGCWQVEGSCRIWPEELVASRGWCSWSSYGTRQPGGSCRPCGSSLRRLQPERLCGGRRRAVRRGDGGGGEEDGGVGREGGSDAVRGGEMGRRTAWARSKGRWGSWVEREVKDQTEERVQTERLERRGEPLMLTGRSFYESYRDTHTGSHLWWGQLCLTTTLSTGSLRRKEQWVIEQGIKRKYNRLRTWTHTGFVTVRESFSLASKVI